MEKNTTHARRGAMPLYIFLFAASMAATALRFLYPERMPLYTNAVLFVVLTAAYFILRTRISPGAERDSRLLATRKERLLLAATILVAAAGFAWHEASIFRQILAKGGLHGLV